MTNEYTKRTVRHLYYFKKENETTLITTSAYRVDTHHGSAPATASQECNTQSHQMEVSPIVRFYYDKTLTTKKQASSPVIYYINGICLTQYAARFQYPELSQLRCKYFFCKMKKLTSILLLMSSLTMQAQTLQLMMENPVILADMPDPDVVRVNNTYYLMSTTMFYMPGAPIMQSKDLINWELAGYVFDKMTDSPRYDLQEGTAYGRGQ